MRELSKNKEKPFALENHHQKGAKGINQLLIAGFIPMGKPAHEQEMEEDRDITFSELNAEGLPPRVK